MMHLYGDSQVGISELHLHLLFLPLNNVAFAVNTSSQAMRVLIPLRSIRILGVLSPLHSIRKCVWNEVDLVP